uniref:Uncharacterized protein n=1 Tax=Chenopodium quinoa TaxID=63459 RepID=A0A803L1C7_CHEQI
MNLMSWPTVESPAAKARRLYSEEVVLINICGVHGKMFCFIGALTKKQMSDLSPCIIVPRGGEWLDGSEMSYIGGRVRVFDGLPMDVDDTFVKELIESLAYTNIVKLHFLDPRKTLKDGVRYLGFERSTFDPFLCLLLEYMVIHVYTEHECGSVDLGGGSFLNMLTSGMVGKSNPRSNVVNKVDYDSEGTDEDDIEVAESKGKETLNVGDEWELGSDNGSYSEGEDDDEDCGYLIAPDTGEVVRRRHNRVRDR